MLGLPLAEEHSDEICRWWRTENASVLEAPYCYDGVYTTNIVTRTPEVLDAARRVAEIT